MTPTRPVLPSHPRHRSAPRVHAVGHVLLPLALAALLAAAPGCGGGGGGGGGSAPAANPPTGLSYPAAPILTVGVAMTTLAPTVGGGAPTQYSVSPALPAGIDLDPVTGAISGTPTAVSPPTVHTITASNTAGSTTFDLLLEVQAGPVIPVAEFVATAIAASEAGGTVNLSVALSDLAAADVTIPYTVGGTAGAPDYAIDPSPLVIVAGTLVATIAVTPVNDGTAEGNETVIVTLGAAAGADIGPANVATVTITDPAPGPCNLVYSDPSVVAGRFASMVPITPSVGCGGATGYTIAPALPPGLALHPTTGVISGTPTELQGPLPYTVTASNALGSTTAGITIEVEAPLFELAGESVTVPYNPATGIASGEFSVTLEELPSPNQAGVRNIAGYSLGLSADPAKVTMTAVLQGADQLALNGGLGAEFFTANLLPGGATVGVIFDFQQQVLLTAATAKEILVLEFDSVPAFLVGNLVGAFVPVPFTDTLGTPPVDVIVTVSGQSAIPQTVTPIIQFDP